MKLVLLLMTFFVATNSFSQPIDNYERKPWEVMKKKFAPKKVLPYPPYKKLNNTKPNVFVEKSVLKLELGKEYLSNNGNGANVYRIMPHKMPCLIPDLTFESRMPVVGIQRGIETGLK